MHSGSEPCRCQKKAGDAPALQKINHPAHKSFHFGVITSRDYTSQPLKPPMWRNGRRNGLKIRSCEKRGMGSNPIIGTLSKSDFARQNDRNEAQRRVTVPRDPVVFAKSIWETFPGSRDFIE